MYGYFPVLCMFSTINASWDCTVVHCLYYVLGEGLVEISLLLVIRENTHFKNYLGWQLLENCVTFCVKNPSLAHRAGVKVEVKGQIRVDHLNGPFLMFHTPNLSRTFTCFGDWHVSLMWHDLHPAVTLYTLCLLIACSGLHNFQDFWLICLICDHINPYPSLYMNQCQHSWSQSVRPMSSQDQQSNPRGPQPGPTLSGR